MYKLAENIYTFIESIYYRIIEKMRSFNNRKLVDCMKYEELKTLHRGDIIRLKTSEIAEFIEMGNKTFTCNVNGKTKRTNINMLDEIITKTKLYEPLHYTKEFKRGELIYINDKGDAKLFIFKEIREYKGKKQIIATNPMNDSKNIIEYNMFMGKVKDLIK